MRPTGSLRSLSGFLLAYALLAVPAAASPRATDRPAARVDEVRREFNRAYSAGDAAALAALVADDAVWMPPGEPAIVGREAVRRRYAAQFAGTRSSFTLEPGDIEVAGDIAWLRGGYTRVDTPATGGPSVTTVGKYLMTFERRRGEWMITTDIWNADRTPLQLDARIVLNEFRALAEWRLRAVADLLAVVADTVEARSGGWEQMLPLLQDLAATGLAANAVWFARPDGSYFTVEQGLTGLSIADRPYFPDLLAGRSVLGVLVVSRSTGKRSVVVAEPVKRDGRVIGAVGVSYSVDALSREIDDVMALPPSMVFYALDSAGQSALHRNPALLFEYPSDLGDESLRAAVAEMLSRESGTVEYVFRGIQRTVLFQRSEPLGWVFALGFGKPVEAELP